MLSISLFLASDVARPSAKLKFTSSWVSEPFSFIARIYLLINSPIILDTNQSPPFAQFNSRDLFLSCECLSA